MISRRLLNVTLGIALSGCTINQYGPTITIGEDNVPTVVDVKIDRVKETPAGTIFTSDLPSTTTNKAPQKTITKPSKVGCVPMPIIPDPPKINLSDLDANKDNDGKLQEIFESNHRALYRHSKSIKKQLEEWYSRKDRC